MKLHGKKLGQPAPLDVFIPRGSDTVKFTCAVVTDFKEFLELCPEPQPPEIFTVATGERRQDPKDPNYLESMKKHGNKRVEYIVLKSLQATEGLEWTNVTFQDHSTWENYREELSEFGLTDHEINYLVGKILMNNVITDERVEEARKAFLATGV